MAPGHDWYLPDWMHTLRVNQARLGQLTGWDKRKVSHLVGGKQRYTRETLNEAADALHLRPYELLMHPSEAMRYRELDKAIQVAADNKLRYEAEVSDDDRRLIAGGGE